MADIPFPLLLILGVLGLVILAFVGNFVVHNFNAIMDFFAYAVVGLIVVAVVAIILFVIWGITQNPGEIRTVEDTGTGAARTRRVAENPVLSSKEDRLPTNNDSIKAGVAAYHAGEYTEAYRLLKPLAEQGDADAQAYVRFISEKVR